MPRSDIRNDGRLMLEVELLKMCVHDLFGNLDDPARDENCLNFIPFCLNFDIAGNSVLPTFKTSFKTLELIIYDTSKRICRAECYFDFGTVEF
jgi:hypothetical protein